MYVGVNQVPKAIEVLEHIVAVKKITLTEDDESLLASQELLNRVVKSNHSGMSTYCHLTVWREMTG
ncbi:hypothetical protein F5B21DRAFT_500473 [Xylaria acuta]|nr:hypothetical protein F5B21DRAFT_500473 [Xylaria acuta]